jgi:predicted  nucleic acid-binding Zn-ribbon protein
MSLESKQSLITTLEQKVQFLEESEQRQQKKFQILTSNETRLKTSIQNKEFVISELQKENSKLIEDIQRIRDDLSSL